jgi:hypothetical protein
MKLTLAGYWQLFEAEPGDETAHAGAAGRASR